MQLLSKKMPDDFNLFLAGDFHVGTKLFHERGVNELFDVLESNHEGLKPSRNFIALHGDMIEAITVDDPRFHPALSDTLPPLRQADMVVDLFRPIARKIVVTLEGNHERALLKFGCLAEYMAQRLGVDYGTYSAKIAYVGKDDKLMFKHYLTHGRKTINSTADDPERRNSNEKLILKRHMKFKHGDTILNSKGHTHKIIICEPSPVMYLSDDGETISTKYTETNHTAQYMHPDSRWYVNTGSWMRLFKMGHSGYAEVAEYDPVELGCAVALIRGRKIVAVKKIFAN